jgi:iron(III) transport system ATP-binding protein
MDAESVTLKHSGRTVYSPLLAVSAIGKRYGAREVLRDISFSLDKGAIGCLLGPSGCGKTTALRAIAGFEAVNAGEIVLGGRVVSGPGHSTPPEQRHVGMMFQDYALFPHLTVEKNVAFGLRGLPRAEQEKRVTSLLETMGLSEHARAHPHQLSGGQQQRVSLARALAPRPALLLMDEPFSNLDVDLRERLSLEVREILKKHQTTALIVTHDQHEAFAMADVIGVMQDGRIAQWDTPYNLYHQPANRFVADFIGQGVLLPGTVLNSHQVEIELGILKGGIPGECSPGGCQRCGRNCHVEVLLRPDDIVHDDTSPLLAEVEHKAFRGADILYTLRLPAGGRVLSLVPSHHNHALGEKIGIRLDVDHVVAFRAER